VKHNYQMRVIIIIVFVFARIAAASFVPIPSTLHRVMVDTTTSRGFQLFGFFENFRKKEIGKQLEVEKKENIPHFEVDDGRSHEIDFRNEIQERKGKAELQDRRNVVEMRSFDRDNLVITVKRKPTGGYRTALKGFVKEIKGLEKSKSFQHESTIVYCPTQAQVEEVTAWLEQQFDGSSIKAQSYHSRKSIEHQSDAKVNFLTGKTSVIVATVAFGMGIDKTDTR